MTGVADERRWLGLSHGYGLLVAAGLGYFLLRIPIQVTDCFTNMLALDRSFGDLMRETFSQRAYLRPGLWAELKMVYELADGGYFAWFRLTQAVQVLLVIVLFVQLLQPRTVAAAVAVPLSLAVLIGHHTFAWTVREAFPINTFLTILVCCAAAANIAFARHRWWSDAAAACLFIVAALTVESGLLVWVILVGAYLMGLRGVSRGGVAVLVGLLAIYFWMRFGLLDVGVPGLLARDAGFGFERYDAAELNEMFGGRPYGFYAYNVLSSILTVLFAEPRNGVWQLTNGLVQRAPEPAFVVNVMASVLATGLVCRFAWKRRHAWMARRLDRADQLVVLFTIVLAANAVISYAYTKDVIVSPAGMFFAAAVFVGCRDLVEDLARRRTGLAWTMAFFAMLSCAWAIRAVGIHAGLADTSVRVREEWAYVDDRLAAWGYDTLSPRELALKQQLQDDAVLHHPANPQLREKWTRLFDTE